MARDPKQESPLNGGDFAMVRQELQLTKVAMYRRLHPASTATPKAMGCSMGRIEKGTRTPPEEAQKTLRDMIARLPDLKEERAVALYMSARGLQLVLRYTEMGTGFYASLKHLYERDVEALRGILRIPSYSDAEEVLYRARYILLSHGNDLDPDNEND